MIQVEHLSRRYGEFTAVDKVSFNIASGEIVGLLGHNGAGKTTIMKMLTGFLEPSGGKITIGGYSIANYANQVQQLIGYLPENLPIYPEMNVIDYLFYCANVRNIPKQESDSRVKSAIEKTMLQEKAFQAISTLSRGFKQRVGVAQSLIHSPKLLILDEPTNGLDPYQTTQMRELIKELAKDATVILSTHIMQEVDALCSRVLILDNGKLSVDETMQALQKSETFELRTNAPRESVNKILAAHNVNPSHCSGEADDFRYLIPIPDNAKEDELAANLVAQLTADKHKVFSMHALQRDLETVFRSVHENDGSKEIKDVA
ncbi:MAG: ABC transporter ATP-binding protein [Cellvibrionaceae bacterium]|nr:ABC transporter ATP-binding protein [Cellvibrionaceae bacterium]